MRLIVCDQNLGMLKTLPEVFQEGFQHCIVYFTEIFALWRKNWTQSTGCAL